MTDHDVASGGRTDDRAGEASDGPVSGGRPSSGGDGADGYEGSGAWGTWALGLLLVLFAIAAGATVHSIIITFTG